MTAGTGKARAIIRALPLAVIDCVAVCVAFVIGAWMVRTLGNFLVSDYIVPSLVTLAIVNIIVFVFARMYNTLWEYASVGELLRIVIATLISSVIGDVVVSLAFNFNMPFSTYVAAWIVLLIVCGASRFAIRLYSGHWGWNFLGIRQRGDLPLSLIVGAGKTGALTVKRMLSGDSDMVGAPFGYVDDSPSKLGQRIHGVRVLGTCDDIPRLCESGHIEQIVIAVPSSTKQERDRIYKLCMQTGIRTLTLPLIHDMPQEIDAHIPLRDVEISDLLAREEIMLDPGQLGYIAGKRVLVTGGGGSIGSELVRQLLKAKPSQIILFDIYENTTYELYHEIVGSAREEGIDVRTFIGSITHIPAIGKCFDLYEPEVVFHAAAHKHVPLMERNAREAIENNVFGTLNVVRLAHEHGCTHFVQISTDKAVNPANVMGATKRMDEMIVKYYAANSKTVFTSVRFGNVLGSHGSVIPLFKRQLREGGPITLTDKNITRYFMTIPEASCLVITAGALAKGGEIFVLNMGEPVRIYDLAVNLITLSGLKPGRDIEIKITGLRPGEKMYEELLMEEEELVQTANKDIRISVAEADGMEEIQDKLAKLEGCLDQDNDSIKRVLSEVVPTYHPQFGSKEMQ